MDFANMSQNVSPLVVALFWAVSALGSPAGSEHPNVRVGSWIWAAETHDRQMCRFVRSFEIPGGTSVALARLRITADNNYEVFLDDQSIGRGSDWRVFIEYDLKLLLKPGEHSLAVSAQNDFDLAALICGLRIETDDGRVMEIVSDNTWKIAPNETRSWKQKTPAWKQWPEATVLDHFPAGAPTQIYYAPPSRPIEVAFWQRGWVQISLLVVVAVSCVTGLFLANRLHLQSERENVVRRERTRIAMDLHDGLGGGLTQLVLFGEKSRMDVPPNSPEAAIFSQLCSHSRGLLREMNETVWLINSQRDNFRDFASYMVKYAEVCFQNSPIRCRFDIETDLPPLPCDLGTRRNLFLAAKEALSNILRHSMATVAEMGIHRQRQELVVTIRDDGQAFNPGTANVGNGLRNMEHRILETGGQFKVVSRAGSGTTIEFRVPLRAPTRFAFARILPWNRRPD